MPSPLPAAAPSGLTALPPGILREYDIRGIVGDTLLSAHAYSIGRAFASEVKHRYPDAGSIAVGRDGRLTSPELEDALIRGITDSGLDAVSVGLGPTPMLYFATVALKADAGVMVTGSHNPPQHNGFKMLARGKPFFGKDIQGLGQRIASGDVAAGRGSRQASAVLDAYADYLAGALQPAGDQALTVVWDAGNGAAGEAMRLLATKLPGRHHLLFETIDGQFPNHHPDPSVAANLQDLIAKVRAEKADIGIAFDGDGDRIGLVDGDGNIWWGDQIMHLLAGDILKTHAGATIIADVKASQNLFDAIARMGGQPLMWKTGHSLVKSKMAEVGSPLAGEMSGHIFFGENHGFDDALYAAVKMLKLLSHRKESLSELRATLPKSHSTPEIRMEAEGHDCFAIIAALQDQLRREGIPFSDVDGIRAANADGWWLLRASNTQAVLVARCEGKDEAALLRLKTQLAALLTRQGVEPPAALR